MAKTGLLTGKRLRYIVSPLRGKEQKFYTEKIAKAYLQQFKIAFLLSIRAYQENRRTILSYDRNHWRCGTLRVDSSMREVKPVTT